MERFAKVAVILLLLAGASASSVSANEGDEAQKSIVMKIRVVLRTQYMKTHAVIHCRGVAECEDNLGLKFPEGTRVEVRPLNNTAEVVQWTIAVYQPSSSGPLVALYNFFKSSSACPSGDSPI